MFFFRKASDPLNDELRRLEEEQRKLEQQVAEIEQAIHSPVELENLEIEQEQNSKGATFLSDPHLNQSLRTRNRASLKVQQTKARNRFIILFIILIILGLIVYHLWHSYILNGPAGI